MHLVTAQLEMTLEQIFKNVGPKISYVRPTINRRPASVDTDGAVDGVARLELFDLTRVRVKKAHLSCRARSRHLSNK